MDIERKEEQKFSFVAKMQVGKPGRDVEKKNWWPQPEDNF